MSSRVSDCTSGPVATVGTFDGVHVGHQMVVRYLLGRAAALGTTSRVITFDPHPRAVVRGENVPLLTTVAERVEKLAALGVDDTIVLPFTPELARMRAEDFVVEVLVGQLGVREIVIGYDHGFGRGREGDAELMRALGATHGFTVDVIPPHLVEEHTVSSTLIRDLLREYGDAAGARTMLGAPYRLSGTVVQGEQRGRLLGFPTANLKPPDDKVIPLRGVYAVKVLLGGKAWPGMLNIGARPTFEGVEERIEVHLLGFRGDLYGASLSLDFMERLRDERRFDGIEALKEQLNEDARRCTKLFGLTT